jgi:hypothetical protein
MKLDSAPVPHVLVIDARSFVAFCRTDGHHQWEQMFLAWMG